MSQVFWLIIILVVLFGYFGVMIEDISAQVKAASDDVLIACGCIILLGILYIVVRIRQDKPKA